MTLTDALKTEAAAWRADDPDPDTIGELDAVLAAGDAAGLADRFQGSLEFGTAGLRGILGAGPNRMNRKVVLRATAGLCAHVLANVPDARTRGICIGFDGRKKSRLFAEDAAAVALGMGLPVYTFPDVVPTPVLAYACVHTNAAAGIMVTASHNPPEYNGYKVYWENGAQIIPPIDAEIAAAIAAVGPIATIPRVTDPQAKWTLLGTPLERAYLDGVRALAVHPELPRALTIAYTALHGVGNRFALAALREAGFTAVHSVAAQAEPDGDFPTVAFPNPEEKGAMDLVLALAKETRADLVLANDPDADRLAVAIPDGAGGYRQLTGNEVGCLLGHYLLDQGSKDGARLVVSTLVSSPMLGSIARAHGARWEPTLTGFKWIANRALVATRDEGARFVLGYEEALGYTVGTLVRDKDGVGTAVVFADLAAWCASRGVTIAAELEHTWRRYGMFLSRQVSETLPGAEGRRRIDARMARVRAVAPTEIAGHTVTAFMDLGVGRTRLADGSTVAAPFPPGDVIAMDLAGEHRVMLRPSGTEPKIKTYYDVCVTVGEGEPIAAARARGEALIDTLAAGLARIAAE